MKILILLIVMMGLGVFVMAKKQSDLHYELNFLTTTQLTLQEALGDVRERYLVEYVRAKQLQEKVNQLERELAYERSHKNDPVAKPATTE